MTVNPPLSLPQVTDVSEMEASAVVVAQSKVTKEMIPSGKAISTFPSTSLVYAIELGATVALLKVTNEIVFWKTHFYLSRPHPRMCNLDSTRALVCLFQRYHAQFWPSVMEGMIMDLANPNSFRNLPPFPDQQHIIQWINYGPESMLVPKGITVL